MASTSHLFPGHGSSNCKRFQCPPTSIGRLTAEPGISEDDEFWTNYCTHACAFDRRMIDDWAKIVDTILVYAALFTSALSTFSIEAIHDFQPSPGDITNQILIAIYNQTMNASHPIDLEKYLRLDHNKGPTYRNVVLFSSLAIAIIIAVLATMAKIWIIRYDREVNAPNPGPPRSRVIQRQEIYDGSQAWGLGKLIEGLPVMTLISAFLFALFILDFIGAKDQKLGFAVTIIFQLGLCYLFIASFCGAFISDAPFHSSISYFINLIFRIFPNYHFRLTRKRLISARPIGIIFASLSVVVAVPYLATQYHPDFTGLLYLPVAAIFAMMVKGVRKDIQPRRYSLQFFVFSSAIILFIIYTITHYPGLISGPDGNGSSIFYSAFAFATVLLAVLGYTLIRMSAVKPATTAVNAIGWMLKTSSSLDPTWFQKAVQIAGDSHNFRVLLLEHLLPLAEPLILRASGDRVQGPTALQEAYLKSLEDLMDLHPVEGDLWCNEAPIPSTSLRRKLENLKNIRCPQMTNLANGDCRLGAEVCPYCHIRLVANQALEKFGLTGDEVQEGQRELHEKMDIECIRVPST